MSLLQLPIYMSRKDIQKNTESFDVCLKFGVYNKQPLNS